MQFGCYVQVAGDEVSKIPEIDLCIGTNDKKNIVEIIENHLNKKIVVDDVFQNSEYSEFGNVTYNEKTRSVIKVQDGCDRFCSYCLIPYARGRVRSRRPESVIEEIKELVKKGFKEVVITGIHVASYGKDFNNGYGLIDLLEEINNIQGLKRVRLGSIEPLLLSEEFVDRFSKLDKMCHHFHLSLQSGCDETLARMNRRYTTEEFRKIVDRIRNKFEDSILTTDIIVGFPGETEEEFAKTYEFLKEIKFYKMHIFKFSVRKGTKAELMDNQILPDIKEKRSKLLIELSDKNEIEYLEDYIGKEIEVLFEEKDEEGFYKGHTSNYIVARIKSNENVTNQILKVVVDNQKDFILECSK